MNDINFIDLVPNSMGQISYRKKKSLTEEQRQKALTEFTKRRFSDYINRLSVGAVNGNIDPMDSFSKARGEAHDDIELLLSSEIKVIWVQVGQRESQDLILSIEKDEDFLGWENPHFISLFKTII